MVLKIDLKKAYNRMEWEFVEETLRDASLLLNLINVSMSLMRRSSCCLLWNGEETEKIRHGRGLRQEDPSSRIKSRSVWSVWVSGYRGK